ncbi:MAG TPA: hypothetical protein VNG29_02385 [Candidatus Paceibacterota bacterium]|nr:hypothetical protein [Candidatus Paceibacterota bacterium]
MFEVRLEKHYGKEVFVSVQAEAARKSGCLCVHEENGHVAMCEHLKANIAYEKILELSQGIVPGEKISTLGPYEEARANVVRAMKARAKVEMEYLAYNDGASPIFADGGICRIALINYAVCLSGNLAMAVTRCPHFKEDAEKPPARPSGCCS